MDVSALFVLLVGSFVSGSFGYDYQVKTFQVPVDHFSFSNNDTFSIRYLINDTYWKADKGPILFYTGNEGDIELFCNNTGFIWDIAPEFNALIVFAEHRYYGHSLPYGNKSFSSPKYSGYLTSQQALADYVDLLYNLTSDQKASRRSPVIAIGGSYGGMLAAYIRMKYPHIISGAIAASAPIWQFSGMTPCEAYSRVLTSVYQSENETCRQFIRKSWHSIDQVTGDDAGKAWLTKQWSLCKNLTDAKDIKTLKDWLIDMYSNIAMANYPYDNSFLGDLPAYPVRNFCKRIDGAVKTPQELLQNLYRGISLAFNFTGTLKCFDIEGGPEGLDVDGWDYQTCKEMVMPMCSDGYNDMFEPVQWDFKENSENCFKKYNIRPDPYLMERTYGGKNIQAASNIVFSNGLLDPWSSGGVLKNLSKTLVSVIIPEGAHHLDLRGSHTNDPDSVRKARNLYRQHISYWISNTRAKSFKSH